MSFERKLQRNIMKKQLKEFKKSDPKFRDVTLSQFKDIWTRAILNAQKEASAQQLTENLDDMLMKEVVEDETPTPKQKDTE